MRNPERADTGALVENLGNVAAFDKDGHAQGIVLDLDRTPFMENHFRHKSLLSRFSSSIEGVLRVILERTSVYGSVFSQTFRCDIFTLPGPSISNAIRPFDCACAGSASTRIAITRPLIICVSVFPSAMIST